MAISEQKHYPYAVTHFTQQVRSLMDGREGARVLEIGGNQWPRFALSELPKSVASYTVNDIDGEALKRVAAGYRTACFDITGDVRAYEGQFDLIFSQFVAEHVRDGRKFHANVHRMLAPGGVALHLIPTLYSSPFLLNRLLPEQLTEPVLKFFFPHKGEYPKFPAYYSYCRADKKLGRTLDEIGFKRIDIRPFYGHAYYDKIPVVKQIENAIVSLCARNDWRFYASYAYLTVGK